MIYLIHILISRRKIFIFKISMSNEKNIFVEYVTELYQAIHFVLQSYLKVLPSVFFSLSLNFFLLISFSSLPILSKIL